MLLHGPRTVVIIPTYNNATKLGRCLRSVWMQQADFHAIVVDDASDDNTEEVFNNLVGNDYRFQYLRRPVRMGPLVSRLEGCREICSHKNDLVITLDGDDEVADENVFRDIIHKYEQGFLYIYGKARTVIRERPTDRVIGQEYPPNAKAERRYRDHDWHVGFPRCFPYWALDEIPEDYLKIDGEWITASTDLALFLPIMEMVHDRVVCIKRVCHYYHREVPVGAKHAKHVDLTEAHRQLRKFRFSRPVMEPRVPSMASGTILNGFSLSPQSDPAVSTHQDHFLP